MVDVDELGLGTLLEEGYVNKVIGWNVDYSQTGIEHVSERRGYLATEESDALHVLEEVRNYALFQEVVDWRRQVIEFYAVEVIITTTVDAEGQKLLEQLLLIWATS